MSPYFRLALALVAGLLAAMWAGSSVAATYSVYQREGFGRLAPDELQVVPLYSITEKGQAQVDKAALPKFGEELRAEACFRSPPSSVAYCVLTISAMGISFIQEFRLNLVEV